MVGTNPIVRFCFRNDVEISFILAMEDTVCRVPVSRREIFSVLIIDLFEYSPFSMVGMFLSRKGFVPDFLNVFGHRALQAIGQLGILFYKFRHEVLIQSQKVVKNQNLAVTFEARPNSNGRYL